MKFRPCIDIHNGKVKQIVGGSLLDAGNQAEENFVAKQDAAFYARLYKDSGIRGGHIILLNKADSEYYEADLEQARGALSAYPKGLQIGGGITAENAQSFLELGASHVIVTSYVFQGGQVDYHRLRKLEKSVGRKHLVLDLSCRRRDNRYYIVTDRWQNFTQEVICEETLHRLESYADEFLVHAVDVEGKANGVEKELIRLLAEYTSIPVTYAGGVGSYEDIDCIKTLGKGRVDVTIGSALDIFGGRLEYNKIIQMMDV